MKLKSFLAIALLFATGVATAARPAYKNPTPKEFPIVAWYSMTDDAVSHDRYVEMREAGFNLAIPELRTNAQVERTLAAANGSGVKVIVRTNELATATDATVRQFMGNPNVGGWYLKDEPNAESFKDVARLADAVSAIDPSHLLYVNLFPNYVNPNTMKAKTYLGYLEDYISTVDPQILSFDSYPTLQKSDGSVYIRPEFYANFETVKELSDKNSIPFWTFCLATAHNVFPVAREPYLNLEAFAGLAYGAQGLEYYTYWQPKSHDNYRHGPIDGDGHRTDVYYMISALNKEIQKLSPIFLGCKILNVGHTGKTIPQGTKRFESLPAPFTGAIETDGEGLLISHLKGGDGHEYLLMVNRDINKAQRVTAPFSKRPRVVGADGKLSKANATMDIRPGGHILYRLR